MLELNKIYNEDCLGDKELGTGMWRIPDKSIDMILCDLPYGTTECKWDTLIPLDELWKQYKRIIKDNGAIVLTASQPFTSILVSSNLKMFRYELIWEKNNATGFMNAKKMPLKNHENILVFYKKLPTYNPQGVKPCEKKKKSAFHEYLGERENSRPVGMEYIQKATGYPKSVHYFPIERGLHPTQKPVALFEYLIKTYTNEGDIVLDNCIGSGTTAIACISTNRKYIGFEIEKEYYDIAVKRIEEYNKNIKIHNV
ncbi:putative DNA cytosine methylase [Geobacillus virus E3]|uniref:putative DNA cytosine methylase n=1 Tax=Geobacillus virus E3 TaxID=1572712 RepID=UPI0006719A70|nr:putative DNA cytosine methylase [Geobacillus virus E3]AJA41470.1 putative DNA cytosine methylase [Geobacillus virus E3]